MVSSNPDGSLSFAKVKYQNVKTLGNPVVKQTYQGVLESGKSICMISPVISSGI